MSAAEKALALLNGLRDAVTNLPVRGADPRLAKTFLRVSDCIFELEQWCMESTALEDRALIAACAPYLKDGETPAECIARNRADIDSVLTLLAQAKQSVQHLATCATNGHVYGHAGACIFCGEPKSTPVEPAGASQPPSEAMRLRDELATRVLCVPFHGESVKPRGAYLLLDDVLRAMERPAPVSPVEPTLEPPTDFTAPLPPRPPAVVRPRRYDLVRYGVTWPCVAGEPLLTPMPDGYWTPWHLAVEAPTGAPAPCVWREFPYVVTTCGQKRWWPTDMMAALREFKGCPYCGSPLTVE